MPKRISWKKGMRLTDEVLLAADHCADESIHQSLMLASAGRFGLLPSLRPFSLSLNIASGYAEVTSLQMTGITRAGDVIDVQLDSNCIQSINNKLPLPEDEKELFLTINVEPNQWKDTEDGYMEPQYSLALITPQTTLSDYAIPIGHLTYNDVWEEDTARFVPPCLYLSAHHRMEELRVQLVDVLKSISEKTKTQAQSPVKTAISIYWPIVQQVLIQANTEHETMSPAGLLGCIQKVVGGFALACDIDEVLNLEDAPTFYSFSQIAYNYQKGYLRLKQGLGMCHAINEKIDKFSLLNVAPPKPEPKPEPKPDPRRSWLGKQI